MLLLLQGWLSDGSLLEKQEFNEGLAEEIQQKKERIAAPPMKRVMFVLLKKKIIQKNESVPVYKKEKPSSIQNMFDSIARNYDKANQLISFQFNKRWNSQLVNKILIKNRPHKFLDLCAGTGEVTIEYLKKVKAPCEAILVDFSPNMLAVAQEKIKKLQLDQHKVHYVKADVQDIPLEDRTFDCAAMAYGIRNVKDPAQSMREVNRLLKSGGQFAILEATQPENLLLRIGHYIYLKGILPFLGNVMTSNQEAYEYLGSSIRSFVSPKELLEMLKDSEFVDVSCVPLMGGIATLFLARKRG